MQTFCAVPRSVGLSSGDTASRVTLLAYYKSPCRRRTYRACCTVHHRRYTASIIVAQRMVVGNRRRLGVLWDGVLDIFDQRV